MSTLPSGGILETSALWSLEQLMSPPAACTQAEQEQIEEVVLRIASDLSLASNRELTVHSLRAERHHRRPAGKRKIHISFKLTLASARGERHGCLLMPLPDAISLSSFLMFQSDDSAAEQRGFVQLDEAQRRTMLEASHVVSEATRGALELYGLDHVRVDSAGCQGVRPDIRPAFPYVEGDPLLVGVAESSLAGFEPFEMLLLLPELEGL